MDENPTTEAEAFDETDVPAALERETADGPGFTSEEDLPEEDFAGYTDDDAEADQ